MKNYSPEGAYRGNTNIPGQELSPQKLSKSEKLALNERTAQIDESLTPLLAELDHKRGQLENAAPHEEAQLETEIADLESRIANISRMH